MVARPLAWRVLRGAVTVSSAVVGRQDVAQPLDEVVERVQRDSAQSTDGDRLDLPALD